MNTHDSISLINLFEEMKDAKMLNFLHYHSTLLNYVAKCGQVYKNSSNVISHFEQWDLSE